MIYINEPFCGKRGLNQSLLCISHVPINSLPKDKILDWSKVKGLADDKKKCDSKIEICVWNGRKHCGKRGNAAY